MQLLLLCRKPIGYLFRQRFPNDELEQMNEVRGHINYNF